MTAPRPQTQTTGLIIATVLGVYSLYLQYHLIDQQIYRAVSESRIGGWTLVQGIAAIVAVCTMTAAGILAGIALTRSTRTWFPGTGLMLAVAAAAWVVRELLFIVRLADDFGAGQALQFYFESSQYTALVDKWPLAWVTLGAATAAAVLLIRPGRAAAPVQPQAPAQAPVAQAPVAPAPVAQAPVATPQATFHVHAAGTSYGPYDLDQMRQLVLEGRVQPQTRVWPGSGDWMSAADIPGLMPQDAPRP
ncbi:DUF4339 domain-containing protein [Aeromicrobium wangtongii]|uniref:DUF4339 domain-containing protein n=1 Tax=Aeromicrobium wangtongii TaxID=2969247 RepID=A0ABY5M7J9_9ACTN|nr:DUF4339 domain-containing protein [Aeromicrobium wangtongii]MCD9199453.1 DUF4339 domain-containing protein [Aeromicrobium wangtongii]UUP13807.1 DUF4339 domain-containing protein [Aeromicrobium wangtongii]